MRDGIKTLFFVFTILFTPLMTFDLFLNQGKLWQIVVDNTFIDETFNSVVQFIL